MTNSIVLFERIQVPGFVSLATNETANLEKHSQEMVHNNRHTYHRMPHKTVGILLGAVRTYPVSILIVILLISSMALSLYAQERKNYWVYFTDKGSAVPSSGALQKYERAYQEALTILSPRALQRRGKVLPAESVVNASDAPVSEQYIREVKKRGGELRQKSRWLNAASFSLTEEERVNVLSFPFVKKIAPVARVRISEPKQQHHEEQAQLNRMPLYDYGLSFAQVDKIKAIPLHEMGISGNNVRIGALDSGFRWKIHEALKTRNVIAEYDFLFHDSVTSNEEIDSPSQDAHGTSTFSVIGGFMEGELIGPAYGAEFLLAKTEFIPSETHLEEDAWAAGIEWLEAQGADIASSSVGYNVFDDGGDYTWENGDFDGRTSVVAQAAIHAARLGVLVCTSMGNEGIGDGVTGTLLTPADADSILSVGAITMSNALASFSSTGPTNDGRMKPEIVAPGTSIYCASPGTDVYGFQQGNSMSTPLVAASAALVLSARPELTAAQVRNVILETADTALNTILDEYPNNFFGHGLVNAFSAALFFGPIFSNEPAVELSGSGNSISTMVASRYGIKSDSVILYYKTENDALFSPLPMLFDSSMFFTTSGRYTVTLPPIANGQVIQFYIEATDSAGNSYQSPAPALNKQWHVCCGATGIWSGSEVPAQSSLLRNYPNPFNSTTTITFELSQCEQAEVSIYSVNGQKIKSLYHSFTQAEATRLQWHGENEQGEAMASGVYLVQLKTPSLTSTTSIMLLR